jgi:hypothetical protein
MQVLVLASQNAVEYKNLGVATSGITLFRSIGGSLGTAVLGAIFAGSLAARLTSNSSTAAIANDSHEGVGLTAISQMTAMERAGYLEAFTGALGTLFIVAACIAAVGFALTWLLEERTLRETVAATAGASEALPIPTDDDSLRQLSQGLWVILNREGKKRLLETVAARANVNLSPLAVWLLMRREGEPSTPLEEYHSAFDLELVKLQQAEEELRSMQYVDVSPKDSHHVALSAKGIAALESIYSARESLIAEKLKGWKPMQNEQLADFLHSIARDRSLVS